MGSPRSNPGKTIRKKTFKNLLIFASGTLISRIFGFLREIFLAYSLGASHLSDVFYACFRIVNFLRVFLGESLMQVSLVPLLVSMKNDKKKLKKFIGATFSLFFIISLILSILGIIFSPFLISIFAPGFKKISFKFIYAQNTLKIMFPFVFFIVISAYFGALLNSEKKFFVPSFSPFFFNFFFLVVGIFSLFFLKLKGNFFLYSLSVAIVIGGFFQAFFQFPFILKRFKIYLTKNIFIPELRDFFKLIIPAIMGVITNEVIIIFTTFLASFLPEGELSYLSYSFRLRHFPVAILGIGLATVSLTYMSENKDKLFYLQKIYKLSISVLFPLVLLLIIHSDFIVKLFFERGNFTHVDTLKTSVAFILFCVGILPSSLFNVHLNYFYSRKKIIPANISYLNMLTSFLVFSPILLKTMGYAGLALSSSIANFFALLTLNFYTPEFIDKKEFLKFIIISLIFSLIVLKKFFINNFIEFSFDSFLSLIFFFYFRKKWKLQEI